MKHDNHIILLVEDDPDDALMMTDVLDKITSIDIVLKTNGIEGLNYLEETKKNNHPLPCLIILDINMPVLDGKKMLALLKKENDFQYIPVVVFTTSFNENDRVYCEGFNVPMVTKPNDLETFNLTVRKFLEYCTAAV